MMQRNKLTYRLQRLIYLTLFCFLCNAIFLQYVHAQCAEPDASIWLDTWVSCEKRQNPKQEYGTSHWIQYDFGSVRTLSKSWIWNTNDPNRLGQGFKNVKVDYSEDGQNWIYWGEMEFPKAQGNPVYGGFPGPDLLNIKARYVLLTAISTHGAACAGLAEVKFNLMPEGAEINLTNPCTAAGPIEDISIEELEETEVFIVWEYEVDEELVDESGFVFQIRLQGMEEWLELEPEEPEVYLDELSPGTTYEYRILFFCDESELFSSIKSFTTLSDISTDTDEEWQTENVLQLSPNPTKGIFVLQYFSTGSSRMNYSIKDLSGKTLLQYRAKLDDGYNQFSIDLSELPNGVYLVDAFDNKQELRLVERIVKIGE